MTSATTGINIDGTGVGVAINGPTTGISVTSATTGISIDGSGTGLSIMVHRLVSLLQLLQTVLDFLLRVAQLAELVFQLTVLQPYLCCSNICWNWYQYFWCF
jgi:hypothetical protein